jgi:GNAT superfamily N-acetyltransferase
MEVVRIASAEEFLTATEAYRLAEPTRTNVVSSVAMAVARGDRTYDAYFWWVALGDAGECVGAAFRTVPFPLHIGPMPLEALPQFARAVAEHDDAFTRIVGPDAAVAGFLRAYATCASPGSRRRFERGLRSLLYELVELVVPCVEGSYRVATLGDIELVAQWTREFHDFTGVPLPPDDREREFLVARLTEKSLRLWSVNDTPVAMAGHAPAVDSPSGPITRIGPVFTPEQLRGHGYGSAVSGALCQELRARGSRVILYADADYPVSNRVYQQLGFRQIDELTEFDEQPGP